MVPGGKESESPRMQITCHPVVHGDLHVLLGPTPTGTREVQTVRGGGVRENLMLKAVSQNEPHGAAMDVRERLPPREGCTGKKAF